MPGWMSLLGGTRTAPRDSAQTAIIDLREKLLMLEKTEAHVMGKIDAESTKAKDNATSNKRIAIAALRQKKFYETKLDQIAGQRLTLETQINTLESANLNAETITAMRKGADALKGIHKQLKVDQVDTIMDDIREQMDLTNEVSEAISNPIATGTQVDEDELLEELAALEQEELDNRLVGADNVPVHAPAVPQRASEAPVPQAVEDDDDAELRRLQAEFAS